MLIIRYLGSGIGAISCGYVADISRGIICSSDPPCS